jgi:hypothetical protein
MRIGCILLVGLGTVLLPIPMVTNLQERRWVTAAILMAMIAALIFLGKLTLRLDEERKSMGKKVMEREMAMERDGDDAEPPRALTPPKPMIEVQSIARSVGGTVLGGAAMLVVAGFFLFSPAILGRR